MTDLQKKMMDKLGLSKEDFEPINKDKLLEEAYLKAEYNSIILEQLGGMSDDLQTDEIKN
jgi:hypothetical protein|nr:MAG TPA: hypothetical protein [Caudoviricetes sp.]